MFKLTNINEVIQEAKAIYFELRDFPQSRMIGEFCIEPTEDGGVKIFDSSGRQLLTLWFDDEGNIIGYDDYINEECVAGSLEENCYYCERESKLCTKTHEFCQAQNYAVYFCEEPKQVPLPEKPSVPLALTPQEDSKENNSYYYNDGIAILYSIPKELDNPSIPATPVLFDVIANQGEYAYNNPIYLGYISNINEDMSCPPERGSPTIPSVQVSIKNNKALSAKITTEKDATNHLIISPHEDGSVCDHSEGGVRYQNKPEGEKRQNQPSNETIINNNGYEPNSCPSDNSYVPRNEDEAVEINNNYNNILLSYNYNHAFGRDVESPPPSESKTTSQMAGSERSLPPEILQHVFIGAPVLSESENKPLAQVFMRGPDDRHSDNIESVNNKKDASDHHGEPNERHNGNSGGEEEEEEILSTE